MLIPCQYSVQCRVFRLPPVWDYCHDMASSECDTCKLRFPPNRRRDLWFDRCCSFIRFMEVGVLFMLLITFLVDGCLASPYTVHCLHSTTGKVRIVENPLADRPDVSGTDLHLRNGFRDTIGSAVISTREKINLRHRNVQYSIWLQLSLATVLNIMCKCNLLMCVVWWLLRNIYSSNWNFWQTRIMCSSHQHGKTSLAI